MIRTSPSRSAGCRSRRSRLATSTRSMRSSMALTAVARSARSSRPSTGARGDRSPARTRPAVSRIWRSGRRIWPATSHAMAAVSSRPARATPTSRSMERLTWSRSLLVKMATTRVPRSPFTAMDVRPHRSSPSRVCVTPESSAARRRPCSRDRSRARCSPASSGAFSVMRTSLGVTAIIASPVAGVWRERCRSIAAVTGVNGLAVVVAVTVEVARFDVDAPWAFVRAWAGRGRCGGGAGRRRRRARLRRSTVTRRLMGGCGGRGARGGTRRGARCGGRRIRGDAGRRRHVGDRGDRGPAQGGSTRLAGECLAGQSQQNGKALDGDEEHHSRAHADRLRDPCLGAEAVAAASYVRVRWHERSRRSSQGQECIPLAR